MTAMLIAISVLIAREAISRLFHSSLVNGLAMIVAAVVALIANAASIRPLWGSNGLKEIGVTAETASWFIVIVPILSTQSTSIVAASSAAKC
jgi:Co/Zn/Cd efflux system component